LQPTSVSDKPHRLFLDVPSLRVLEFLESYSIDPSNSEMQAALIRSYIREQNQRNHIKNWTVAVITRNQSLVALGTIDLGFATEVALVNRARFLRERSPEVVDIKALMSETDVAVDVPQPAAELRGRNRDELRDLRDVTSPDKGLLLIYPISKDSQPRAGSKERAPLDAVQHVIGLALAFPDVPQSDLTPQNYMTVELPDSGSEQIDIDDLDDMEVTEE
jgi:hypothetical protein